MIRQDVKELGLVQSGAVALKELPAKRTLTIRTPNDLLAMKFDDSDRLLGDRLLAKGQPLTILGAGGTGKSRLVLQLAVSMITGRDFLTFKSGGQGLRWLFIQTENSNQRLQRDLTNLKSWIGDSDWNQVDEFLTIHTLENDEDGLINLDNSENLLVLEELIKKTTPDIIVFDPLGEFAIGDPNTDKDMRETCRALSKLAKKGNPNRAIVVLHHALTGKQGAVKATGYDRTSFGRNSKVLQTWTRAQINVSPGGPDDNSVLVISCGKCSNGKEFDTFAARLNPNTMIYEVDSEFDLES